MANQYKRTSIEAIPLNELFLLAMAEMIGWDVYEAEVKRRAQTSKGPGSGKTPQPKGEG